MTDTTTNDGPVDYNNRMQANLSRVFGEKDAEKRVVAIADLYAEDAVLYEPDSLATGHAAINRAVESLLSHLPPTFAFVSVGPAVGHHGVGRLRWQSGPTDGPVAVTGTDVATFEGDLIKTLHVFIDPSSA
jgi:hypothetical protein